MSATLKTTGPWTAPQRITASSATSASDGPQVATARGVATSDSAALAVPYTNGPPIASVMKA